MHARVCVQRASAAGKDSPAVVRRRVFREQRTIVATVAGVQRVCKAVSCPGFNHAEPPANARDGNPEQRECNLYLPQIAKVVV